MQNIRPQFPILKRKINGKPLVYLDNAATTQKPKVTIDALTKYYTTNNANVHRGIHTLSEEATTQYEHSRKTISQFIGAIPKEIVFTRGTTESINLVARALGDAVVKPRDEILVTQMEHHSNLVPWQQLCRRTGAILKVLPITDEGRWDMEQLGRFLSSKTKIVAVSHCSNVLGSINPITATTRAAHSHGAVVVVDGAQAVAHIPVNVRVLDCDFYAFSSHKMYGPTGVGVLYGKQELLERMEPVQYGGDMVNAVEWFSATWNDSPWKFEAGTQDIGGIIAFGKTVEWIQKIGMDTIESAERTLTLHLLERLNSISGLTLQGPNSTINRIGVASWSLENIHPHDIATILNDRGIAIRSGHHCAMPLMTRLGVSATSRASLAVYNTKKEIDELAHALDHALKIFKPRVTVDVPKRNLWQH